MTFINMYVIADDAQNFDSDQIKKIMTRQGPGSKLVICGDVNQSDVPHLKNGRDGLTHLVRSYHMRDSKFRNGHILLTKVERSQAAEFAEKYL